MFCVDLPKKKKYLKIFRNKIVSKFGSVAELEKLDGNYKKKTKDDVNQRFINEEIVQSKIAPVSKGSSIPVKKVKTIKKHSKVRKDLNVQDVVQHRPTVGDIEWGEEKRDTEREVEDIDDECVEEDDDDDEQEIDANDVIKEISTLALEDVQHLSSLDQSDPIVLISSGDDDYSGDIDEFILIEAPNNYTAARHQQEMMQQQQQRKQNEIFHENKTISTTTTREYDTEGREIVTIRREECGPDGEIIVTEEIHDSSDYPQPSHGSHFIQSYGSDTDEQLSPVDETTQDDQILSCSKTLENNSRQQSKTLGSSSGSDVALHERGAESSEDETGTVIWFLSRKKNIFVVNFYLIFFC